MNGKGNLHIDLKNLILINICAVSLICFDFDGFEQKFRQKTLKEIHLQKEITVILFFTI